jgi:hypothetical protein
MTTAFDLGCFAANASMEKSGFMSEALQAAKGALGAGNQLSPAMNTGLRAGQLGARGLISGGLIGMVAPGTYETTDERGNKQLKQRGRLSGALMGAGLGGTVGAGLGAGLGAGESYLRSQK